MRAWRWWPGSWPRCSRCCGPSRPAARPASRISRPAWKNLVFTGGPGTGKSRAAAALAGLYRDLGVLRYGNLIEVPAADLPGPTARDTAALLADAENGHAAGNARLAVQMLTQATTSQAHRVTTSPQPPDPAALAAICAADIPGRMPVPAPLAREQHPGQYL